MFFTLRVSSFWLNSLKEITKTKYSKLKYSKLIEKFSLVNHKSILIETLKKRVGKFPSFQNAIIKLLNLWSDFHRKVETIFD